MSEQDGTHSTTLHRPANGDRDAWQKYWKALGQPWRWEPEIDSKRQEYLSERRKIEPDFEQDIYPFKDIKLNRADVEWLLVTHENGRGPVNWNDESQREREGVDLRGADLSGEHLPALPLARIIAGPMYIGEFESAKINLEGAELSNAHLEGAYLYSANLEGAYLYSAHLEEAALEAAHLERANLEAAHLEQVILSGAHLEHAYLYSAHLEHATLTDVHLEEATLTEAHLEGAYLHNTHLEGAILTEAFFDRSTKLNNVVLSNIQYGTISLADAKWGDVNVAVVDWSKITRLGDEHVAKEHPILFDYQAAVRAYRQLSVVLRNQGLNEDAARFTYRAQLMQRKVYLKNGKYGQYLFSGFLDLLSGYGYKPLRCFIAYLLVILAFATAYFIIGHKVGPVLSPLGSVVFSMTSFHGRGFFPGGIALDDPLTVVAAFEAFIGLLIEVTFIATLTQRLFGR